MTGKPTAAERAAASAAISTTLEMYTRPAHANEIVDAVADLIHKHLSPEREELLAVLEAIAEGEWDDLDPHDGLCPPSRSARDTARGALAKLKGESP